MPLTPPAELPNTARLAWSATPLMNASVAVHAVALGSLLVAPEAAAWAAGALVLNHLGLAGAGLWPRSQWLGPNLTRLAAGATQRNAVALTIDDGPDAEVTPQVLDMLDALGVKATFFCIAQRAQQHAALVRNMLLRGHDVQNHSLRHKHNFALMGPTGLTLEVSRAQAMLADITGVKPHCFRAPAGLRNPFLDRVLHHQDLLLTSWTRRGFDTRERNPQRVLQRLNKGLSGGDILLMHDGNAARTEAGQPVILSVVPPLVQHAKRLGLHFETLSQAVPRGHGSAQPLAA